MYIPLAALQEVARLIALSIVGLVLVTVIPWKEKKPWPPKKKPRS